MATEKSENQKKITPLSFIGSIIAAWFGVQSKANRERDFEHGKFHHFVIGGIIFAVLFILLVVGIVKVVMHYAGA
ncbi:MAG: DUF2970 domain-containing protein [Gammaproteobacteria bacterium]|nr:DUF2970 domain-containing protein [Gammaproteobacteria bacterium]